MKHPELSPIIAAINKLLPTKQPVVVALDGQSGSGKSTLTKALVEEMDAVRIDQDDFYRGGSYDKLAAMSDQERAEYEMDWQRMRLEVLEPLTSGKSASYHPFDWDNQEGTGLSPGIKTLEPASIIVIDGVFSARKELEDAVDFSVLVTLPKEARLERLLAREGDEFNNPINDLWDAAEIYYFDHICPRDSFDIVVDR